MVCKVLIIAAGNPTYPEMIEYMERELTKVIEDFDRAMSFETLRLANETSKLSFSQSVHSRSSGDCVERAERDRVERERVEQERIEQELVLRRLKPVEAGYHRELCCMDGTRQSLLNQIIDWAENKSGQDNVLQRNAYWFYGSPGIGKTSFAHSICASLHERNYLAGSFFSHRHDPNISKPRHFLPTFINHHYILFSP